MGCSEPAPDRKSPAAAAAAAVVQGLCCKAPDGALQELLVGVPFCSLQLSLGDSSLLCSGNLCQTEHATSLLAAGCHTLAGACIAARRAKLLRG